LGAEAEGRTWTPTLATAATPIVAPTPQRAATAAATRSLGSQRSNNSSGRNSPASFSNGGSSNGFGSHDTSSAGGLVSGKERNENYFATLGQANNSRDV
jgi:uncharacterized membrane protein YgcG